MKKIVYLLGFLVCLICGPGAVRAAGTIELLADTSFERGFRIKDPEAQGRVVSWKSTTAPVWNLVHHHSKSSFANEQGFTYRANGLTFQDEFGMLAVHPPGEEASFILGVNASREFGGVYRKKGEPWPHWYLTQLIGAPGGHLAGKAPSLAELAAVDFSIEVRLVHGRANTKPGHNPKIHAAQFVFFFTIQNLNRKSAGFGDYFWLGAMPYDDRKPVTALFAMQDKGSPLKKGTDKLIYDVGFKPFTEKPVASGEWVAARGDLLPQIMAGLEEGWKRGFLSDSRAPADYRVGMCVMGWEVTGLNDAAVAVRGLRATARLK